MNDTHTREVIVREANKIGSAVTNAINRVAAQNLSAKRLLQITLSVRYGSLEA